MNNLKQLPDYKLIHIANKNGNNVTRAIDEELERRYEEVREELEWYEFMETR